MECHYPSVVRPWMIQLQATWPFSRQKRQEKQVWLLKYFKSSRLYAGRSFWTACIVLQAIARYDIISLHQNTTQIYFKSFTVSKWRLLKTHLNFKTVQSKNFNLDENQITKRRLDAYDCVCICVSLHIFTTNATKNMILLRRKWYGTKNWISRIPKG